MKKWIAIFMAVWLCVGAAACFPAEQSSTPGSTGNNSSASTSQTVSTFGTTVSTATTVGDTPPTSTAPPVTPPTTFPTTAPTAAPTTKPPAPTTRPTDPSLPSQPSCPSEPTTDPTKPSGTGPVVPVGWLQRGDQWYYFNESGEMTQGFALINGGIYYFGCDGAMRTGWVDVEERRYYFSPGGLMQTGWISVEGNRYYLAKDGTMCTGWLDLDGKRYYLAEDGAMHTGWLMLEQDAYYLKENGVMARGMLEIDGEKNYFTSSGAYIMLVNPWNAMPEGYEPELVTMTAHCSKTQQVDARCYESLMQMLEDCKAQCQSAVVVSSYRTVEYQQYLFNKRIQRFMDEGYSQEEATRLAAQVVAVPGTSEHHLGLAVDIVDNRNWHLDESQAEMPAQKWLMENSWKYGFILRYPVGKTDATGIIYEPWHYRYVGNAVAKELYDSGLTLEEYLRNLTEETNAQ